MENQEEWSAEDVNLQISDLLFIKETSGLDSEQEVELDILFEKLETM